MSVCLSVRPSVRPDQTGQDRTVVLSVCLCVWLFVPQLAGTTMKSQTRRLTGNARLSPSGCASDGTRPNGHTVSPVPCHLSPQQPTANIQQPAVGKKNVQATDVQNSISTKRDLRYEAPTPPSSPHLVNFERSARDLGARVARTKGEAQATSCVVIV